jgi:hypothetical protein
MFGAQLRQEGWTLMLLLLLLLQSVDKSWHQQGPL